MKDLKNEELEQVSGGTVYRFFTENNQEVFYSTAAKKFYSDFKEARREDRSAGGTGTIVMNGDFDIVGGLPH